MSSDVNTGSPSAGSAGAPSREMGSAVARARRVVTYDALLRLSIRHDYYGSGESDHDIVVRPSPETRDRLRDRGLLLRAEREGCFVLGDRADRARGPAAAHREWLAFLIEGSDEYFAIVSDGDLEAARYAACVFLSPPEASNPDEPIVLRAERLPILPAALSITVAPGDTIDVLRRGVSVMWLQWPAGAPAPTAMAGAVRCDPAAREATLELASLPAGRYTIQINGRPERDGLRLPGGRIPAALVEIPLPALDGPVAATAPDGAAVHYQVRFEARQIIWKYSIVPRNGSGPLENLSIEAAGTNGSSATDVLAPSFVGPFEDTLPNGARAYQFFSTAPIALRRRSLVRLRLTGRRRDRMSRDAVLVECLPVPGRHQLALLSDRDRERIGARERFCSEMFVHV